MKQMFVTKVFSCAVIFSCIFHVSIKAREIQFEEFEDFGKQSKVLADLSFPLVRFLTLIFSHEELC